jgi:hypothetical protein
MDTIESVEGGEIMDRDEYVKQCKASAREYLAKFDIQSAITSMISDMNKRDDTRVNDWIAAWGIMVATRHDFIEAKRFIEGFN